MGHNYIGHNYIDQVAAETPAAMESFHGFKASTNVEIASIIGHNYVGLNYVGHDYVGHGRP